MLCYVKYKINWSIDAILYEAQLEVDKNKKDARKLLNIFTQMIPGKLEYQ